MQSEFSATRFAYVLFSLILLATLGGCTASRGSRLDESAIIHREPWAFAGLPGETIHTAHYSIHTTIDDPQTIDALSQLMESSLREYQNLAPGIPSSQRPLDCYIFAKRAEWARFTKDHTGEDARIYLQINRGGYTIADWFAAYYIGDVGTYAVASHEGWHQYVARNFHSRLPPFLEEGIATMFENVSFDNGVPRWNLAASPSRIGQLETALQQHALWPLPKLCTMHAGNVVGLSPRQIEMFYAQDWAFTQFLLHGDNEKHHAAFAQMLTDLASGAADQYAPRRPGSPGTWDPRTARPLLEHYFGNLAQLDIAYQKYIRAVVATAR